MSKIKIFFFRCIATFFQMLYAGVKVENKVFFVSFSGLMYSENPRSISEKMHELYPEYKQVWAFKDLTRIEDVPSYIAVVKYGSLKMIKEMSSSKVWIDNGTKSLWINKKKSQLFIKTWHGGLGIKKVGAWSNGYTDIDRARDKHSFGMTDILVSNSRWFSDMMRNNFPYTGKVLEIGAPKSDVFFRKEAIRDSYEGFRQELGLDSNTKILLYAPTFRDDMSPKHFQLDFERILKALEDSTKENWVIFVKLHHYSLSIADQVCRYGDKIINATTYSNMQRITMAADYFLTDYSSGIFDFALLERPGFLYADDYEDYSRNERGLSNAFEDLPFIYAYTQEDLIHNLVHFDRDKYQKELAQYFDSLGFIKTDHASEDVCKIIYDFCQNNGDVI